MEIATHLDRTFAFLQIFYCEELFDRVINLPLGLVICEIGWRLCLAFSIFLVFALVLFVIFLVFLACDFALALAFCGVVLGLFFVRPWLGPWRQLERFSLRFFLIFLAEK